MRQPAWIRLRESLLDKLHLLKLAAIYTVCNLHVWVAIVLVACVGMYFYQAARLEFRAFLKGF